MEINEILEERRKTNGDFKEHAMITQQLKNIVQRHHLKLNWEQRESIEMILHKIGRILAGSPNTEDHWDDIAGYAILGKRSITGVI